MKKSALLLLLVAAPAWADPPTLNIPPEITAQPGQWVVVAPETTAKAILYIGLDGLAAFPSSELKDPRKLVVNVPNQPGAKFRFVAVGTLNDEMAQTTFAVVVAGAPVPPPPPTDPFQAALQAAFQTEAAAPKLTQVQTLARFYRTAAGTTVNNPALKTYQDLQAVMKLGVTQIGLPHGALAGLISIIASDELRAFPNPATVLDPTTRAAAASEFIRIAAALEGLK